MAPSTRTGSREGGEASRRPFNAEPRVDEAHISVADLRLQARVGVNPGERGAEQPVIVDVWVGLEDLALTARSERLRDAVDYVSVARAVRRVVSRRHYPLVETLTHAIATAVLQRPGVTWARVRLRKLDCLKDASSAGVELTLRSDPREVPHPSAIDPAGLEPEGEAIVIVGGGAAGLTAALWCWRLGHPALLVDPNRRLGGQLHLVHGLMRDLPALRPMTGALLAHRLWRQFMDHQGRWLQARLVSLDHQPKARCRLELSINGDQQLELCPRSVILTTGVRRRALEIPGERRLAGRGVLATAARGIEHLADEAVVVIGGGDSACENALLLARAGAAVTLVHRGPELTARAQFRRRLAREPAVTQRLGARATRFIGADALEGVSLVDATGQGETVLSARAALVRAGWLPNSEPLPRSWLDERGFLRCDNEGQILGAPGCFAAGDLLGRISPSVATSFGSGASAARAACLLLEAGQHGG